MPHMISVSDETFAKMQAHAIPLVDTPDSIILRALTVLDMEGGGLERNLDSTVQSFNPAAPPSLSHTTLRFASLCGTKLEKAETSWNSLMIAVIREAFKRGKDSSALRDMLSVNSVIGPRETRGYKYIHGVGLSVQGQDANSAWRQSYDIARQLGFGMEIEFVWQDSPKTAMPGVTGRFSVGSGG